jgi:hypothetical protein
MTALDTWLKQATRHLSKDSTAQVRIEIQEHYESAREAATQNGATADEADRLAVHDLGNAKKANRQYREVLLTSDEAKMLREGNWEARAVCSRPWLKWMLLAMPLAALFAAATLFFTGSPHAWPLFAGGTGIGLLFAAPFLPIYTPSRGRVFRVVKWVVLLSVFGLAFGKDSQTWLWLGYSFLWPAWIEWKRISIRRKLPVSDWPRHLYL